MVKGVVFYICKLPPEDMQIRPTFSMETVGLEPSFPMKPAYQCYLNSPRQVPSFARVAHKLQITTFVIAHATIPMSQHLNLR
jgi:hypothetical protein